MRHLTLALAAWPALACPPPEPVPPDDVWPSHLPSYVRGLDGLSRAIAKAVHTPEPVVLGIAERAELLEVRPPVPPDDPCAPILAPTVYIYRLTMLAWDGATFTSRITRTAGSIVPLEDKAGRLIVASDHAGSDRLSVSSDWPAPNPAQIIAINRCIQQRRCTEAEIATLGR